MGLNPEYVQQSTRALPFCVGYVYAQGSKVNSMVGPDGATVEQYILAEGEWDSCLYLSVSPTDFFSTDNEQLVGGGSFYTQNKFNQGDDYSRSLYYHFHGGSLATKGVPNNLISQGPDQGSEIWLRYFPSVTPQLCYSGLAYYFVRRIIQASDGITGDVGVLSSVAMQPTGIYRSLRCRMFDATGEVTGYGFTVNPTWQMTETVLRYQIKQQQPSLAGLTRAEKACFDWPALVDHANRNAALLSNGAPTYAGNFAFASDATLASMMETQLRNCRSYKRERGGVIAFIGDDPRVSVFTFSQRNVVPNTVKISKKDLSTASNVYIPQYRDLGIPAVTEVVNVEVTQADANSKFICTFTTNGQQPLFSGDSFTYSGSSDDADFAGDYRVELYSTTTGNQPAVISAPPIPNQFNTSFGPQKIASATGGFIGTQQSRFSQRAPTVVQHRAHQKAVGQVAPGIIPIPRATPVYYDLGNNTFDQTNRIMQWMMARDLGTDGPNWKAPFQGTISGYLESVDVNGNALAEVENGDIITIDPTASPEFAGDYEVVDNAVEPASSSGSGSQRDLTIQTYNPAAFVDVSYPPGDSYSTLPNSLLPMGDSVLPEAQYYVMQATPSPVSEDDGTVTVNINDLSIWWAGQEAPTAYPTVSLAKVPTGELVTVYLAMTTMATQPTMSFQVPAANVLPTVPAGSMIVFYGTYLPTTGGSPLVQPGSSTNYGGGAVSSDSSSPSGPSN
ncbi:hypothetical protein FTO74_14450 [Granulicella sp. WH15]|uniref:hypothetical protein n=1 Tax=Granulicella sp. WH15 TaxID=2602070 RepID=UPI001366F921|nr:hypothetical protein [Granulicella sp. WH15]QHN04433.1 hypothetical protein FTO74_14450 [Granulicella sp. WH15]